MDRGKVLGTCIREFIAGKELEDRQGFTRKVGENIDKNSQSRIPYIARRTASHPRLVASKFGS